jgi:hypothetical protein
MITQLAAMRPFLPRWWPRYGRFGHPEPPGTPVAT